MKVKLLKKLNLIPLLMAGCLTAASAFSLVYIYSHGAQAIDAGSASERTELSKEADINDDGSASSHISKRFNCLKVTPDILTADGETIRTANETVTAPYYNLIGYNEASDSRYIMECYWDSDQYPTNYSVWKGIRRPADYQAPVLQTTLNAAVQQTMYDYLTSNGIRGSVFAYDYTTGEILCAVSTPAASSDDDPDSLESGALMNKTLLTTPPGSTQKLVTLFLLAEQGVDLEQLSYNCEGSVTINGNTYYCEGTHGTIGANEAVAWSCNAFFAQAVSENLDFAQAAETLKALGWSVNGSDAVGSVGKIPADAGSVNLNIDAPDFATTWTLIGETEILISPVWMSRFAAACTGSNVCEPCLMEAETGISDTLFENYADAIAKVSEVWRKAAANTTAFSDHVSFGKTGTYEFSDGGLQKNYFGASEDLHLAFYVTEENFREDGTDLAVNPQDITALLLSTVASVQK